MNMDLSKLIGGKIRILGQEINLGDTSLDKLKELRQRRKANRGAKKGGRP